MLNEPTDQELYNESKRLVDKSYDKPSAYRSMAYARVYLKKYREKYGDDKKAYRGKNPEELKTWRKEKWYDVKSVLKDPKNPTACGNEPIKKGEYPLCMKEKELSKYSESELRLLVQRKNQIGKRRLVKDAFLRDVLEPEKITPIREYKAKYSNDRRLKLPEPVSKTKAEKIIKEKPVAIKKETQPKETQPRRSVLGRPRIVRTEEEKEAVRLAKNIRQRTEYVRKRPVKEVVDELVKAPRPRERKIQPEPFVYNNRQDLEKRFRNIVKTDEGFKMPDEFFGGGTYSGGIKL